MAEPIEPEIVHPEDDGAAIDRQKALRKLDLLIKKIDENTRTNRHLIRLLEERRGGRQLAAPGVKSPLDRVVDHALEAFPPNVLRDMVEGVLHEFADQGKRRSRRR